MRAIMVALALLLLFFGGATWTSAQEHEVERICMAPGRSAATCRCVVERLEANHPWGDVLAAMGEPLFSWIDAAASACNGNEDQG